MEGGCVGISFGNFLEGNFFSRGGETSGVDGSIGSFAEDGGPVDVVFVDEGAGAEGAHSVDHYVAGGGGVEGSFGRIRSR